MATDFQPPPTWADVILVDKSGRMPPKFNPVWLKWFVDLVGVINSSGGGGGTIQHNDTGGLQGGTANQYYHLTAAEHQDLQDLGGVSTGTHSTTFTFDGGGGSTGAVTLDWLKVGNWVFMHVPIILATTGVGSTGLASDTALPAALRPSAQAQRAAVNRITNNATMISSPGTIAVNTAGLLTIRRDGALTAFTNAAQAGVNSDFTFPYFVG